MKKVFWSKYGNIALDLIQEFLLDRIFLQNWEILLSIYFLAVWWCWRCLQIFHTLLCLKSFNIFIEKLKFISLKIWNIFLEKVRLYLVGGLCWRCLQISHTLLCLKSLFRTTLDIETHGKSKFSQSENIYQDSWIKTRLNLIWPNVYLNKFLR